MKRAALIITDEPHVHRLLVDFTRSGITLPGSVLTLDTSEPLLADLWLAVDVLETVAAEWSHAMGGTQEWTDAASRLRDAIGDGP